MSEDANRLVLLAERAAARGQLEDSATLFRLAASARQKDALIEMIGAAAYRAMRESQPHDGKVIPIKPWQDAMRTVREAVL